KPQVIEPVRTQKTEKSIPIASASSANVNQNKGQGSNNNATSSSNKGQGQGTNAGSKNNGSGNSVGKNGNAGTGKGSGASRGDRGSGSGLGNNAGSGGIGKGLGFQKGGRKLVGRKIYPPEAKQNHLVGNVEVGVEVDERGVVQRVNLLRSSGHPSLDKAALQTAKTQYKYTPDKRNGVPEKTKFKYVIEYKLTDY
ncbi:MAG: energy transducer TonB, partial [Neisseriaceae bacterium]|nr:energy transducer TonB [Neisseriaceae bacterium]